MPWEPGETRESRDARLTAEAAAYERNRQRELWTTADRVFTARVSYPVEPPPSRPYVSRRDGPPEPPKVVPSPVFDVAYGETTFVLEPVAQLKGAVPTRGFEVVEVRSLTSCGSIYTFRGKEASFDQRGLVEGAVVVIFLKGSRPAARGILGAMEPDKAVDPDLTAALDKTAAAR